jgi:hypothetical protein
MLVWRTGSGATTMGLDGGNITVMWSGTDEYDRTWHTDFLPYASYLDRNVQVRSALHHARGSASSNPLAAPGLERWDEHAT